jgi:hypothetical protein
VRKNFIKLQTLWAGNEQDADGPCNIQNLASRLQLAVRLINGKDDKLVRDLVPRD